MVEIATLHNELHLISIKMIESALSHPHGFGKPTEIKSVTFGLFRGFDDSHETIIKCHGRVQVRGTVKFEAECTIKRDGDGELWPIAIRCVTDMNLVVIGESKLYVVDGLRAYVTRT